MQQQGDVPQVAITKEDKKRAEQDKAHRFISGARCRRIHLDQAMDDRFNRARCEEGEEVCDVCGKEDAHGSRCGRVAGGIQCRTGARRRRVGRIGPTRAGEAAGTQPQGEWI